jgi:branched-chain amino acid transport system substrate-binding protein
VKEGVPLQDLPTVVRNDALRFTSAIKAIELPDAPAGAMRMTEYNNPVRNIYLVKVVKKEGKIDAVPIHTFPAATQFWKIAPEKFLSQPVFSRDFPPLTK